MTSTAAQAPGTTPRSSTVVAWLLYVPQLLLDLVLAAFAITSVFMTDSCGSVADEALVCNMGYFGGVLFAFWGALLVLVVAVPIAIAVSGRRGTRAWKWPLLGIIASIVLTALFVVLMTQ